MIAFPVLRGLRRIQSKRAVTLLVIVLFIPCGLSVSVFLEWLVGGDRIPFLGGLLVMLAVMATYQWLIWSKCPRCGLRFFFKPFVVNPFRKTCGACGIPLRFRWNPGEQQWHEAERWINNENAQGIIPDVGLRCPTCDYNLTGLAQRRCPECGTDFDILGLVSVKSAAK